MGGIDLCFGRSVACTWCQSQISRFILFIRWDTPQHVLVDDSELNPSKTEIWQGKSLVVPVRLNLLSEAYRQGLQQPAGGGLSYVE